MIARRARCWCAAACALLCLAGTAPAASAAVGRSANGGQAPFQLTSAQVWVAGRQIPFAQLGLAYGDPVAAVDDPGTVAMLEAVGARAQWQPGTSFVAITRADGRLVTFTLGSNAVSVDGSPTGIPFAPFSRASTVYLPLESLGKALGLGVRGFRGGYVFVPQIVSLRHSADRRRTIISLTASAPLDWQSRYDARKRLLTLAFRGFASEVSGVLPVSGGQVTRATLWASGPPGYPTTALTLKLNPKVEFAAHRGSDRVSADIILSRDKNALVKRAPSRRVQDLGSARLVPAKVQSSAEPTARSTVQPTAEPAAEPTDSSSATDDGQSSSPSPLPAFSQSPGPGPQSPNAGDQKISNIGLLETATGTRLTFTVSGPVTYSWHRLADPDNRYWVDVDRAILIGPAQVLMSKLSFIKSIKVSQHEIVPEHVVRISIVPTQAIDVRVGPVDVSPNTLAVDIQSAPPADGAPTSGNGSFAMPSVSRTLPTARHAATRGDFIVIDPGHGGNDPGAIPIPNGLVESHVTLEVSKRVQQGLRKLGWHVVLTRDGDYEVGDPKGPDRQELQARCDIANAGGARLFISIHANASASSSAPHGATTYYWRSDSRSLARTLQHDFVAATGLSDDGVQRARFWVVRHTDMPS
ncbi:MAG: N-acetylmuramoyl-L-alanine amidase, partial [Candidatus Eremiobacteraeota bacterium]|nr:N-acetylmuramoyl-L-alanine amidase [Candidatus Eremiobacteraeota bacterium]